RVAPAARLQGADARSQCRRGRHPGGGPLRSGVHQCGGRAGRIRAGADLFRHAGGLAGAVVDRGADRRDRRLDDRRALTRCGTFPRQSKRLETDSSEAVREIASPIRSAMETTRMLRADRTAGVGWIESVMTSSRSLEPVMRAVAPPERTPWVL